MSEFSAANGKPLRILCITLGGIRQERMERIFSNSPDFQVSFVSGIQQRQLRSRKGLIDALTSVNLLPTPSDATKEEECWRAMRHLNRDRAVLACTLAHLKAMAICAQEDYDVICEDSICGPVESGIAAQRLRTMIAATPDADVRYFAYGGRATEIRQWQHEIKQQQQQLLSTSTSPLLPPCTPWPIKILPNEDGSANTTGDGRKASILWGTMAYKTSDRAYRTILAEIQQDLPGSLAFQLKRAKNHTAKPIDKIIPRFCIKNNYSIKVSIQPSFFRSPISSTIHPKLDQQFLETTEVQLSLCGLDWTQLDLTREELDIRRIVKESGQGGGSDGGKVRKGEEGEQGELGEGRSGEDGKVRKGEQGEEGEQGEQGEEGEGRSGEETTHTRKTTTKNQWYGNTMNGWTGQQQAKKERKEQAPTVSVVCAQCNVTYPSRNSMFKHLRDDGNTCVMET